MLISLEVEMTDSEGFYKSDLADEVAPNQGGHILPVWCKQYLQNGPGNNAFSIFSLVMPGIMFWAYHLPLKHYIFSSMISMCYIMLIYQITPIIPINWFCVQSVHSFVYFVVQEQQVITSSWICPF